ncbi:hypothetical protein SAICODRAFT_203815 [Saitoella complicata NRRL Y-17804]|uniref:uncharacterized protein n=1 Tax=Saitoella complicata (strain BCRC 22490 / CBS 7301 / JCM 7358 / NBRC 10748 / NRRL Y-17804) TaxID=698492 RepID=UPI000866D3CB|nr:uncharacterized protein SAICODRAFT_203815 [Saitoella complicata NRRL Y-17804]ODQ54703.1 hypothetical protein SAICODRAFT_203815 [Saitoella complicata NRRL Y-17804]
MKVALRANVCSRCRTNIRTHTTIPSPDLASEDPTTPTPKKPRRVVPPLTQKSTLLDPSNPLKVGVKPHKHPQKPWSDLTPLEKSTLANPFAKILSSPVRRDPFTRKRLPKDFLIRFVPRRHPATNVPWIVPDVHRTMGDHRGVWTANRKSLMEFYQPKKWLRLARDVPDPNKVVWRQDMTEFVLKRYRMSVVTSLREVHSLGFLRADVNEGGTVSYNLRWENPADETIAVWDDPGNGIPIYHMSRILGDEDARKLREELGDVAKGDVTAAVLPQTSEFGGPTIGIPVPVTVTAGVWLWKTASYLSS